MEVFHQRLFIINAWSEISFCNSLFYYFVLQVYYFVLVIVFYVFIIPFLSQGYHKIRKGKKKNKQLNGWDVVLKY